MDELGQVVTEFANVVDINTGVIKELLDREARLLAAARAAAEFVAADIRLTELPIAEYKKIQTRYWDMHYALAAVEDLL